MATTLIALGSNVGDRAAGIHAAIDRLKSHAGVRLVSVAPLLETAPVGVPDSDDTFVNSAARFEVDLGVEEWLALLLETEQHLGRTRSVRWGARKIDLDLLLFDDVIANSAPLRVPHPRMGFRRFVMQPAVAIGADLWHPICRCTLGALASHLDREANWVWWPRAESTLSFDRVIAPNVPWHFLPAGATLDHWRKARDWMMEKPVAGPGARVIVTDDWPLLGQERLESLPEFPKLVIRGFEESDPFDRLLESKQAGGAEPIRLQLPLESTVANEIRVDVEAAIESMLNL